MLQTLIRRRIGAFLENLYNFGFSRGGPRWPPRHGNRALGPLKTHPFLLKAPLRGAGFLSPGLARKKSSPTSEKTGFDPRHSNPVLPPSRAKDLAKSSKTPLRGTRDLRSAACIRKIRLASGRKQGGAAGQVYHWAFTPFHERALSVKTLTPERCVSV